jgi:hypothetical protein
MHLLRLALFSAVGATAQACPKLTMAWVPSFSQVNRTSYPGHCHSPNAKHTYISVHASICHCRVPLSTLCWQQPPHHHSHTRTHAHTHPPPPHLLLSSRVCAGPNTHGLEDGMVVRRKDGTFTMLSAEPYTEPYAVAMQLGVYSERFPTGFCTRGCHCSHACCSKLEHACDQWHSSRVFTPLTGSHCILGPNTEGTRPQTGWTGRENEPCVFQLVSWILPQQQTRITPFTLRIGVPF